MDDGCVNGTALAASPDERFLAVGSNTGIVNLYDAKTTLSGNPLPLKVIPNLTTAITDLKFNPSSEILALASNYHSNALKLFHTGHLQVKSD